MWRYQNDSQLKFGWILDQSKEDIASKCAALGAAGQTWCSSAVDMSTASFEIHLSASPRLQISFLKSQDATMGSVAMWVDDHRAEAVLINGYWDMPYSVAHTMTFTPTPLVNYSTAVVGDAALLPLLTPGKHTLHLSLPPSSNNQARFKWKLLGITAC
jgi:hypothetical protein